MTPEPQNLGMGNLSMGNLSGGNLGMENLNLENIGMENISPENLGMEQPLILLLLIPIALVLFFYIKRPAMNMKKWLFLVSRLLMSLLVLIALSFPYQLEFTEKFQDAASVTILSDRSGSMSLYRGGDHQLASTIYRGIKNEMKNSTGFESVELKEFSSGNTTGIGDAIYQNTVGQSKENNLLILVSDGNENYGRRSGDVARILGETGTQVCALAPTLSGDEIYIRGIDGEKKTSANSDYVFTVDISKLGGAAKYMLELFIDGEMINSTIIRQGGNSRSVGFVISFSKEGVHRIEARIIPESEDYFKSNNVFIKAVDVVEKPNVLVVTGRGDSPLVQVLKQNYEVAVTGDVGENFNDYAAVFLDNQNSSVLTKNVLGSLSEYVIGGNGLVVIGGDNAYDLGGYKENYQLEAMLPVISVEEPERKRKPMAVILLIDISESVGYGLAKNNPKIDVEKALALNIIKQLDPGDRVGVVAFNVEAFTISGIGKLGENIDEIEDRIPRLKFGGGSDMLQALDRADRMLRNSPCEKYIIIISDGVIWRAGKNNALMKVNAMSEKDITTYTVGVGFDTDEKFMSDLASKGSGLYFRPDSWERLKTVFKEKEEDKDTERYTIDIYNKCHFITRNLKLPDTAIKKYNGVTSKSIAQVLVTTTAKKPVVTVWRFGLGRVVSVTTDNGISWSSDLYSAGGGRLTSAITNWAIGDLEKKKMVKLKTEDVTLGGEASIIVQCDELPELGFQKDTGERGDIALKQIDANIYSSGFTPKGSGFYILKAVVGGERGGEDTDAIAVNYPPEFSALGINHEQLTDITRPTGGRVYNSSQVEQLRDDALEFVREGSLKKIKERIPLHLQFMIAAVCLFFVDVVIRRVGEIMRLRRW